MTNIWGFFLQTLLVSLVAVLLLTVKWLLGDKLSPRWQYGVWGVLALRIILPVWTTGKYILLPIPLWLETVKSVAESRLASAYSFVYTPIQIRFPIPWINCRPESVTDWIFAVYVVGVLALLLWYLYSYIKLRRLLRHGSSVSGEMREQIDDVCTRYNLRSCRAVAIPGLPSAFVCGVFRPVLAVPDEVKLDDKVLLHELLHLRYFDAAQSIVWSIFRALHWCNPFLQYVFNRIGNDMEKLCDQRVLERLEGEQRREYGGILLSMVNEKYPRAPGTTSLSNGGANIARRIESIARFRKYPKGMELVSACIVVVLLGTSLFGTYAQGIEVGNGGSDGDWGFAKAMASARLTRCTTVAGALDTYSKGIMYKNGVYIAAASPLSAQETLAAEMIYNAESENWVYYHLESGPENLSQSGYWVYNLKELPEGGYGALLVFTADALLAKGVEGCQLDENGDPYAGLIAYPVKISYEDAWVVTENGEMQIYPVSSVSQFDIQYGNSLLPCLAEYTATGESGTVTIRIQTIYTVDNTIASGDSFNFFGTTSFDDTVKPKAEFASCSLSTESEYIFGGSADERKNLKSVGLQTVKLEDADSIPEFSNAPSGGDAFESSSNGSSWTSKTITDNWDGTVTGGGGSSWSGATSNSSKLYAYPPGYAARIFWNSELKETLVIKEVTADGTAAAG